jgi:hypothetical protein
LEKYKTATRNPSENGQSGFNCNNKTLTAMKVAVNPTTSLKIPASGPKGQIIIRMLNIIRSNRDPEIRTAETLDRLASLGLNILQ